MREGNEKKKMQQPTASRAQSDGRSFRLDESDEEKKKTKQEAEIRFVKDGPRRGGVSKV